MNDAQRLLKGLSDHDHRYHTERIRITDLNVLSQPRKTFETEEVENLSASIASQQLIELPLVAKFKSRKSCQAHLDLLNRLWGAHHRIGDLSSTIEARKRVWYVLLDGERRIRACKLLWEKSCSRCLEGLMRPLKPGACFRRHFHGDRLEVRACIDISPIQGVFRQLSANTHRQVPPHEEAIAYALLFRLIKEVDPAFTLRQFAREVGRGPESIRRAIRYHMLPDSVKQAVERRAISYGKALEIARLQDAGLGATDIEWWLVRAMTERQTVERFREAVEQCLAERKSGQQTFGALFMGPDEDALRKRHVRRVVAENQARSSWSWIGYLSMLNTLADQGQVGVGQPFSEGSPLRLFRAFLERVRETTDRLRPLLKGVEPTVAKAMLAEAEQVTSKLEVQLRPETANP